MTSGGWAYILTAMPSFDAVSELDGHEVTNAIDQANRELEQRFDFKGTGAIFERDAKEPFVVNKAQSIRPELVGVKLAETDDLIRTLKNSGSLRIANIAARDEYNARETSAQIWLKERKEYADGLNSSFWSETPRDAPPPAP